MMNFLMADAGQEGHNTVFWIAVGVLALFAGYGYVLMKWRPKQGVQSKIYRFLKKMIAAITGKVDLSDEKVASFAVEFAGQPGIYPGGSVALVAICGLDGGKVEKSQGEGQGRVPWKDLPVTLEGATAEEGVVTLDEDPRIAPKALHVSVGLAGHPELKGELTVPVHFAGEYVARFGGACGRPGVNGDTGHYGASGGGEGGRGRDGCDGEAAEDAGDVEVTVAVAAVSGPMLQILVRGTPHEDKYFLVDTNGGSLTVLARGGAGGKGGDGGWGGGGGTGGGNGGDGGDGANGGNGGHGGRITLIASPEAKPYLGLVRLDNSGGDGGNIGQGGPGGGGGSTDGPGQSMGSMGRSGRAGQRAGRPGREGPKPEIRIQPVARLW